MQRPQPRRPRRRRFPDFPAGHKAGLALVASMMLAALLAAGIPGVADGNEASREWMDLRLRTQLRLDEVVVVGTGGAHEDRALARAIQQGKIDAIVEPGTNGAANEATLRPVTSIDYRVMALAAARRAHIRRPMLFVRQIAAESGMQPCATSGAGAIGIAQIMPGTALSWKVDPWIPEDALRVAAQHMARYERQLGSYRLALAAYNAGPGAVRAFGGVPPYAETREYIRRISNPRYPLPGMRQVFRVPQHSTFGFQSRLAGLMLDVRRHGGKLAVEEGWRSYEESMRIWKVAKRRRGGWQRATRWAAPPGCSNHVRGLAADLLGSRTSIQLAHDLAGRHGLVFPMSHEPWHVERAGIPTQSG